MYKKICILLGSKSDLKYCREGIDLLNDLAISFQLRIASAHRTPGHLEKICQQFIQDQGEIFICVAGKSAHLAGVVASLTLKPVLAVPVASQATAGFDSLLSTVQMPKGIPVATFGFDIAGFANACLFAVQILSLKQGEVHLEEKLQSERQKCRKAVLEDDQKFSIYSEETNIG